MKTNHALYRLFAIQRFSIQDGPGIRTTFFFKGCPLRCLWCHNPESWRYEIEPFFDKNACRHCNYCTSLDFCPLDLKGSFGVDYPIHELVERALADLVFYRQSGGGVTLSGGEVLSQPIDDIEVLIKRFKGHRLNIALDTSGYCHPEVFRRVVPQVDWVLFDLKALDEASHLDLIGVPLNGILENFKWLIKANLGASCLLRLPLINELNASEAHLATLLQLLIRLDPQQTIHRIQLLPYHEFGIYKGEKLSTPIIQKTFQPPSKVLLDMYQEQLTQLGYRVTIGGQYV